MAIYYILLGASALVGIPLCSEKCGKRGRIAYCVLFAFVFTVISAIRFKVGYDFTSYGGMYQYIFYNDIEELSSLRMEKGFLIPMYVINLGFEKYYGVIIVTSLMIYPALFYLIYKNSSKPWISVCAFMCFGIFFNSLCFLRQFIAALIVAYASKYIISGKYAMFFILVISAASFHWTALLMALLYFFLDIRPSWIYLGIMTCAAALLYIYSQALMNFFIKNFYMYNSYDPETNTEVSVGLPAGYTVIFGILLLISYVFKERIIKEDPKNVVNINCLMFTVIFEALGTKHTILSRFALLTLIPSVVFLMPHLVKAAGEFAEEKKGKVPKYFSYIVIGVFSAASFAHFLHKNYNGVVPYTSQFNRPYDIFADVKEPYDYNDYFYGEDEAEDEEDAVSYVGQEMTE